MLLLPLRGALAAPPCLTQHREVGAPDHRGDTAAAQDSFTLIVASVAASGVGDGEPAVVVTDAA